jgi:hypothetical protein
VRNGSLPTGQKGPCQEMFRQNLRWYFMATS